MKRLEGCVCHAIRDRWQARAVLEVEDDGGWRGWDDGSGRECRQMDIFGVRADEGAMGIGGRGE